MVSSGFLMYVFLLLVPLYTLLVCFLDDVRVRQDDSLGSVTVWSVTSVIYFTFLFMLLMYMYHVCVYLDSRTMVGPGTLFTIHLMSLFQVYMYGFTSKKQVILYPLLSVVMLLSLAIWNRNDFFVYFMCVESVTASLGFIFVTQGKCKLFNSALLSMVVSNFISLVLLSVCTLSLYTYYGTTDIFYISILLECSYTDYVIITFIIVSVLVKVGQFPVLLYKLGVYLGLSTVQLGFYTMVYTNFIVIPSVYIIKSLLVALPGYNAVPLIILIYIAVLYLSTNSRSGTDLLVFSTSLTTLLFIFI